MFRPSNALGGTLCHYFRKGLRLLDAWLLGAGSLGAGSLGALVSEAAVRYLLRPSNALGGTLCHYFRKGPICA